MFHRIFSRRALVTSAIVVTAAVGSVAGVSLAQGTGGTPAASTPAPPAQQGGVLGGVHNALARLVAAGTIDQQQADAVQAQANAGSIDPKQLVQSGTLTDAQMRTVGNVLAQVKRGFAG
jgi:hypothetical protein